MVCTRTAAEAWRLLDARISKGAVTSGVDRFLFCVGWFLQLRPRSGTQAVRGKIPGPSRLFWLALLLAPCFSRDQSLSGVTHSFPMHLIPTKIQIIKSILNGAFKEWWFPCGLKIPLTPCGAAVRRKWRQRDTLPWVKSSASQIRITANFLRNLNTAQVLPEIYRVKAKRTRQGICILLQSLTSLSSLTDIWTKNKSWGIVYKTSANLVWGFWKIG